MKSTLVSILLLLILASPHPLSAMLKGDERKKTPASSAENSSEKTEEERRAAEQDTTNDGSDSVTRGIECSATDHSEQDDSLNTGIVDQQGAEQEEERVALTLEDFCEALNANRDAARLILDSNTRAIRPWNKADSKMKEKNEVIIAALKRALQADFPRIPVEQIIEEELPSQSMWEKLQGKPALSTATLQCILARADNAMTEQGFVEEHSFTVQHFRNALAYPDNQGEQRLIISGQGASAMIVAQTGSNHVEDKVIRKTLKRALEREGHRRDFVHELTSKALPYLSVLSKTRKIREPLSFEKLKMMIQKADDAMDEIKLLQATRSIVPLSATAANRAAARTLLRSGIEQFFNRLGIQNDALATGISAAAIPKSAEEIATEHAAAAQQEAWEQSECEKIIRSLVLRGRDPDVLKNHYAEAEAAAIAAEAFHNQAMKARWDAEEKEKYLAQARAFFEEVKTALNERRELAEFDESTLNKIAQAADLAGAFLGMFNVPLVNAQGIATAISTFANFTDQKLTIAEAQKTYNALQAAIQKAETATEGHERVDQAATAMHAHAEEIESLKKKEGRDETVRLSNIVRAPLDFSDDTAWRTWATELACEDDAINEGQAIPIAHLLYKQAKKNPATIHELVSKLWGERVALSQQEAQRLEEETFLKAYKSAQEKEIKSEADAVSARGGLEEAAQAKSKWLTKRAQLRQGKKSLEDHLRDDPTDRENRQLELDVKRSELSIHQTQKETIDATYQKTIEAAKSLTAIATAAHADAFEKFKAYDSAKKHQERHSARFKAAAEADLEIFDKILIAEDHRKEVLAHEASTAARDQEEAALARGDTKAAELHKKIGSALEGSKNWTLGAENTYRNAANEQARGNREAAQAYRKSAQAFEAKAAALAHGDTTAAARQEKIAAALGGYVHVLGAGRAYLRTAQEQTQGHREVSELFRKSAQAFEAKAAALARNDTTAAELQQKIAEALGFDGAGNIYGVVAQELALGHSEAAEAFHKCAQAYEAAAAALACNDTTAAKLHSKIASALREAGWAYSEAAQEQTRVHVLGAGLVYLREETQGSREAAEAFHKCAQAYEAQVAALNRGDTTTAELQQKIASALREAGWAYSRAAKELAPGNREAAEAFHKCAQAYEAAAAALNRGDTTAAELHEEIAKALGSDHCHNNGAGWAYSKAAEELAQGNREEAAASRKDAQAYEARAEALVQELKATEEKTTEEKSNGTTTPSQQESPPDSAQEKKKCTIS